jgi:hypothetical protein
MPDEEQRDNTCIVMIRAAQNPKKYLGSGHSGGWTPDKGGEKVFYDQ